MATSEQHKRYKEKYPWMVSYIQAKQRCTNKNNPGYKWYGLKGIKFLLSKEDVKYLWFRDRAWELKEPSIDRENNDGDYTVENCRFIEGRINYGKDKVIRIAQYFKDGTLIKVWESQKAISEQLGIHQTYISKTINGRLKSTFGFIFKKVEAG